MAAVMNMQAPHRKPVPGRTPPSQYSQAPPNAQYAGAPQAAHSMNGSSAAPSIRNASPSYPTMQQAPPQYGQPARRTLSNATSSTSSTSTGTGVQQRAPPSTYANSLRRSTSSRSTSTTSPTSYVALMRKQKATVWCDRAQHEDPRILAAQRQAKQRAVMEVAGNQRHIAASGRTSTSSSGIAGGVRSKIRHHGAVKASAYNAANLSGAGVPMRLSASEVDEGDSGDDEPRYHQRSGSGRSSLGSGNRGYTSSHLAAGGRGYSNGSTPAGHSPVESMGDLVEEETPVPSAQGDDYFAQPGGQGGSGSSGEAEAKFGGIGGLPVSRQRAESARKTSEELRRRGSVDERTTTMTAGRLFVANPDLSD